MASYYSETCYTASQWIHLAYEKIFWDTSDPLKLLRAAPPPCESGACIGLHPRRRAAACGIGASARCRRGRGALPPRGYQFRGRRSRERCDRRRSWMVLRMSPFKLPTVPPP